MELIYSTSAPANLRKDWVQDEGPLCCLSSRNIIAFTSNLSPAGDNGDSDAVYYVYVCDIDKPWDRYLITSNPECITWLEWDASGTQLIITTALGKVQIWSMKDYLLNVWECIHSAVITGEDIVAVAWLWTGRRYNFLADNKDSVLYNEKIQRANFAPSLSHFGGKATPGIIIVVASGLVYVGLLKTNSHDIVLKSESLSGWRCRLMIADITHDSNGDFLVAASDGNIASAVQCYRISLKSEGGSSCSIHCKPISSLYPKCHMDFTLRESSSTSRVTHIKFLPTENAKVLIVGAGDMHTSHVELWNLTDQIINLHRFYQGSVGIDSPPLTHKWIHKQTISYTSLPISIAVPRFPVVYTRTDPAAGLFQYVAISYRDGSIKLINRWTFSPLSTTNLDVELIESVTRGGERVRRMPPYLVYMQQTMTGCGLLGLNQYGCLYIMRAVNTARDTLTKVNFVYLVGMLEYAIIMGYDWWDVLAALRPDMIETVIQKLANNFVKQPSALHELLYARFLAVKSSLYRISTARQHGAADCNCQIMLHSLATAFKAILRPKAMTAQELSPAEKLSNNCSKNFEGDVDKILLSLNTDRKEFMVEASTLQALQPLIQWVADLVLYLLASLPMFHSYPSFPGANLVQDSGVLGMLRELLVIIRVWGLIHSACLPHFTTTLANFDAFSHIFKLLTKVWVIRSSGDVNSVECDEQLIDECCSLPSKVIIPPADQGLFGNTNYEASIFLQPQPCKYTFGEAPAHTVQLQPPILPDGQSAPQYKKDIVRQVTLGTSPVEEVRQCSRCGCLSLLDSISKVSALRAWDLRWARACPCEGNWKVVTKTGTSPQKEQTFSSVNI